MKLMVILNTEANLIFFLFTNSLLFTRSLRRRSIRNGERTNQRLANNCVEYIPEHVGSKLSREVLASLCRERPSLVRQASVRFRMVANRLGCGCQGMTKESFSLLYLEFSPIFHLDHWSNNARQNGQTRMGHFIYDLVQHGRIPMAIHYRQVWKPKNICRQHGRPLDKAQLLRPIDSSQIHQISYHSMVQTSEFTCRDYRLPRM